MKIRTGFVTNSSCGNYVIACDFGDKWQDADSLIREFDLKKSSIAGRPLAFLTKFTSMDNCEILQVDYGIELAIKRALLFRELKSRFPDTKINEFRLADYHDYRVETLMQKSLEQDDYADDENGNIVDKKSQDEKFAEQQAGFSSSIVENYFTEDWKQELLKTEEWIDEFMRLNSIKIPYNIRLSRPLYFAPWPLFNFGSLGDKDLMKLNVSNIIDQALEKVLQDSENLNLKGEDYSYRDMSEWVLRIWDQYYARGEYKILWGGNFSWGKYIANQALHISFGKCIGSSGKISENTVCLSEMTAVLPEEPSLTDEWPDELEYQKKDGKKIVWRLDSEPLPPLRGFRLVDIDMDNPLQSMQQKIVSMLLPRRWTTR